MADRTIDSVPSIIATQTSGSTLSSPRDFPSTPASGDSTAPKDIDAQITLESIHQENRFTPPPKSELIDKWLLEREANELLRPSGMSWDKLDKIQQMKFGFLYLRNQPNIMRRKITNSFNIDTKISQALYDALDTTHDYGQRLLPFIHKDEIEIAGTARSIKFNGEGDTVNEGAINEGTATHTTDTNEGAPDVAELARGLLKTGDDSLEQPDPVFDPDFLQEENNSRRHTGEVDLSDDGKCAAYGSDHYSKHGEDDFESEDEIYKQTSAECPYLQKFYKSPGQDIWRDPTRAATIFNDPDARNKKSHHRALARFQKSNPNVCYIVALATAIFYNKRNETDFDHNENINLYCMNVNHYMRTKFTDEEVFDYVFLGSSGNPDKKLFEILKPFNPEKKLMDNYFGYIYINPEMVPNGIEGVLSNVQHLLRRNAGLIVEYFKPFPSYMDDLQRLEFHGNYEEEKQKSTKSEKVSLVPTETGHLHSVTIVGVHPTGDPNEKGGWNFWSKILVLIVHFSGSGLTSCCQWG